MHIDEDTHQPNEPKSVGNGMYLLRKRTVDLVVLPNPFGPDRKNLAVHVSLSSNLHNVKELTLATSVGESVTLKFCRTIFTSGCPAANLPFQYFTEQWERLALGVVQ